MDPYKNKVLRKSYYSKIKKGPKHKQVKISNFESEAKAAEFLEKWKEDELKKEAEIMKSTPINNEITSAIIDNSEEVIPIKEESCTGVLPQVKQTKFVLNAPDFKKDGSGKSTIILASSQGGKTTVMDYILNKWFLDKNVITIVMSPSINAEIYKGIRKNKNVITTDYYNEEMIKDLARIQRKTSNKYNFAIFLDDIIDEKKSDQILKMVLTYRNLNISTVINMQDSKLVSRPVRHNGNNFIFVRMNTDDAIRDALDLFLNSYAPFSELCNKNEKINMYKELTKNNNFIYLNALHNTISFHKAVNEI